MFQLHSHKNPRKSVIQYSSLQLIKPAFLRLNEIRISVLIMAGEYYMPDLHAHAVAIHAGIRNSGREIISSAEHLI